MFPMKEPVTPIPVPLSVPRPNPDYLLVGLGDGSTYLTAHLDVLQGRALSASASVSKPPTRTCGSAG
ncbi:hypothetical protein GCM10009647_091740 [Streptomyces sanglieri]